MTDCTHGTVRNLRTWSPTDPDNKTGKTVVFEQCEDCRKMLVLADGVEMTPAQVRIDINGIRMAA